MGDFWKEFTARLEAAGPNIIAKTWFPDDRRSQMEAYYQLATAFAQGYITEVYTDPDYPEISPQLNSAINLAAPVPDYMYFSTPLNGAGIYRVFGFRGTSRFVEIAMYRDLEKTLVDGKRLSRSAGQIDLDKLRLGPDGSFEVLLSAERPAGYDGDWVYLEPIINMLLVRSASYDWYNEIDARIGIERIDVPAVKPRLSAEDLEHRLAKLPVFTEKAVAIWLDHVNRQRAAGVENGLRRIDFLAMGGLPGQDYFEGVYKLEEGEGLLIETDVPSQCRYWSILVTDDKFATVDWVNHQSSLNGHQARLDGDGRFRCVIAMTDPGVPNWIDTGGFTTGLIQFRWNQCNCSPEPATRKVKLSELRDALPGDTPVVSFAERETKLRQRRRGALMRRRW